MIVSTQGISTDVLATMVEKKTELQIKMWMLEEDEDCAGMNLEQLDKEYQNRKEEDVPQPTEASTTSSISTSTTSNTTAIPSSTTATNRNSN